MYLLQNGKREIIHFSGTLPEQNRSSMVVMLNNSYRSSVAKRKSECNKHPVIIIATGCDR